MGKEIMTPTFPPHWPPVPGHVPGPFVPNCPGGCGGARTRCPRCISKFWVAGPEDEENPGRLTAPCGLCSGCGRQLPPECGAQSKRNKRREHGGRPSLPVLGDSGWRNTYGSKHSRLFPKFQISHFPRRRTGEIRRTFEARNHS
jgi:hypothetical protein